MTRVHIDNSALARAAASHDASRALVAVAERIADKVRGFGIGVGDVDGGKSEYPLPVRVYNSDRGVSVTLTHPAGIAVQAKHGTLTKAAAAAGFEVHS